MEIEPKIKSGITIAFFFTLSFGMYAIHHKANLAELQVNELQRKAAISAEEKAGQDAQIKELNEYVLQNGKIPAPGMLESQGIPKHLIDRYVLIYIQVMVLAETANPGDPLVMLRDMVRQGVLHHLVNKVILTGRDDIRNETVAQLSISIDWEKGKIFSKLKTSSVDSESNANAVNQPTMQLASGFAALVRREKLKVILGCELIKSPDKNALLALGLPDRQIENLSQSRGIESRNYQEFRGLVLERFGLRDDDTKWRIGQMQTFDAVSNMTPEVSVQLKYVPKPDANLDAKDKLP